MNLNLSLLLGIFYAFLCSIKLPIEEGILSKMREAVLEALFFKNAERGASAIRSEAILVRFGVSVDCPVK